MTEHVSSSSSSSSANGSGMTIDIRPMIEDVSQVMTKHITNILSGVIGEYTVYKETHDTIMGLPCVRRLQERINELEMPRDNNGVSAYECSGGSGRGGGASSREDEIIQLQSAIAELNRYIVALESKVDMKTVYTPTISAVHQEEESIRLEIHENTSENTEREFVIPRSNSKNVIISSSTIPEEEDDEATETTEDLASLVETVQLEIDAETEEGDPEAEAAEDAVACDEDAEANDEDAEDEEAEAADNAEADEDEAEAEEEEDAEADDVVEDAEAEAEDAEAEDAETEDEDAEAEEAEIEVSEVKIKGKTYFTTDPQNGIIYACVDDDVGDEVGVFKNGVAVFNKGKK
jgi:chemotaxis protein histidine kinase CheA